ncbi:hypothetical protein [uncultured Bacteroides sp.]|uniref:hypothetical protein n=1 Tax=uncultured Bacteroides sp. TaxID=162156 RepID=UPI002AAB7029|nr:hypothetical protein [uncultured Bacteroides sp.]
MNNTSATLPFDALTCGYILIPKKLLMTILNQREKDISYLEAFLIVLTKVNYMDTNICIRGRHLICNRGESYLSFTSWAELFKWKRGKTRRFFEKMEKDNMIRVIKTGLTNISCIQVVDYDLWTNKLTDEWTKRKSKNDDLFNQFWNEFHEVTQTPKRDIGAARRAWNKLSAKEKKLAIENVYSYYMGLNDTRFTKRAYSYLRDQSFLNEEIY